MKFHLYYRDGHEGAWGAWQRIRHGFRSLESAEAYGDLVRVVDGYDQRRQAWRLQTKVLAEDGGSPNGKPATLADA
jgi:hypothetical protein